RARDVDLGRLDRVVLVMDGRRRAGEVVYLVHLDEKREADIVAYDLERGVRQKVLDIVLSAREEIIDADDLVAVREEPVAEVGADKSGPSRHKYPFAH